MHNAMCVYPICTIGSKSCYEKHLKDRTWEQLILSLKNPSEANGDRWKEIYQQQNIKVILISRAFLHDH